MILDDVVRYDTLTLDKMMKVKQVLKNNSIPVDCSVPSNWLVPICTEECAPAGYIEPKCKPIKKEQDMAYTAATTNLNVQTTPARDLTAETRDYLAKRLREAHRSWGTYWGSKDRDLRIAFGLEFKYPETPDEYAAAIKDGKYTLMTQEKYNTLIEDDDFIGEAVFSWRDPAIKEDHDGYRTVKEKIQQDHDHIMDIIMVKSADEALAAIQAFEAKTVKDYLPSIQ